MKRIKMIRIRNMDLKVENSESIEVVRTMLASVLSIKPAKIEFTFTDEPEK